MTFLMSLIPHATERENVVKGQQLSQCTSDQKHYQVQIKIRDKSYVFFIQFVCSTP
jgi:hypothetical protein